MSRQDIASLAFRIAGLYTLIQAISISGMLAYSVYVWLTDPRATSASIEPWDVGSVKFQIAAEGIPFVLLLVAGVALLIGSRWLAARLFPDKVHEPAEQRFLRLPALAYSVLGLYLVASSLPQVTGLVYDLIFRGALMLHELRYPLICLSELLIGLVLFFGAHGVARLWAGLRFAGIRREMGLCPRCGYDLAGNVSGRCPECGLETILPATPPPEVAAGSAPAPHSNSGT